MKRGCPFPNAPQHILTTTISIHGLTEGRDANVAPSAVIK